MSSDGAASILLLALVAFGMLAGAALADAGRYVAAHLEAATAADAAALAAAPVTFRPFGADGTPREEAARFAAANRASLVSCRCPVDPSWAPRSVVVVVARRVSFLLFGERTITATGRAEFEPALLIPEAP